MDIQKFPLREFDLEFGEGGERAGAGGGGFFLVGCVLLFLFLKALVELEVDFSLIGYALLLLLVSFFVAVFWL